MDNPNHYRYVVPDDIQLRLHLLRAYHDSPLTMHRGQRSYLRGIVKCLLLEEHVKTCTQWDTQMSRLWTSAYPIEYIF